MPHVSRLKDNNLSLLHIWNIEVLVVRLKSVIKQLRGMISWVPFLLGRVRLDKGNRAALNFLRGNPIIQWGILVEIGRAPVEVEMLCHPGMSWIHEC
jgi:hypothetical protein